MWCLPTITDRRQAVKPGPSPSKVLMLWSVCAGTPLCWWFCSGGPISWRPASYVRSLCGCICGVWPYYQHQQNRGTLPACPWHSTQGSWSIHSWRTNQICPKLHLLRMCDIIRQLYWLRDHKTNTECCKCVWSSRCSSVVPARNKTCNKM